MSVATPDLIHGLFGTYTRTVAPSATLLAVTLEEIKSEIGLLDDDSLNAELMRIGRAATKKVGDDSERIIMTQTWQWHCDRFPCRELELRKIPIQSITHVKYTTDAVVTTLSASVYETDLLSAPARIRPKIDQVWPAADLVLNAVEIEFIAGYASAAVVPEDIKDVILQVIRARWNRCDLGQSYWDLISRLRTFGFVV